MSNDQNEVNSVIEKYRHMSPDELRYDLLKVDQLRMLNLNQVPDAHIRVFHATVLLGNHPDAPAWFKDYCTFAINAWRDGAMDYQSEHERLETALNDMKARLGEDEIDNFFANAI